MEEKRIYVITRYTSIGYSCYNYDFDGFVKAYKDFIGKELSPMEKELWQCVPLNHKIEINERYDAMVCDEPQEGEPDCGLD